MTLLTMYAIAAWMSLFWINGILSWQLTPGAWLESRSLLDGFLNPGFLAESVLPHDRLHDIGVADWLRGREHHSVA